MEAVFLKALNMSLTASWVIAVALFARLPLRKAPRRFLYLLWAAPLARLLVPFSIKSAISLIPTNPEPIPRDIAMAAAPQIDSGVAALDSAVNPALQALAPSPAASANPIQIWLAVGAAVWLTGIAALVIYSAVTLVRLKRTLSVSMPLETGVYIADGIKTPFVIGLFRPKIYLPSSLAGREREYILLHERTHIRRGDHIIKLLAFAALCAHWFNPLVWVAFLMSGRDMESSCDELVLKNTSEDIRAEYSASLLQFATGRRIISGAPLAFGEGGAKERIKNVLNYKEPEFWVAVLCVIAIAAVGVGLICDPKQDGGGAPNQGEIFMQSSLEEALTAELNSPVSSADQKSNYFAVATFELIFTETGGGQSASGEVVRAYGWLRTSLFDISDDGLTIADAGGASMPCMLELERSNGGEESAPAPASYHLISQIYPGDGTMYESSIKEFCVGFNGEEISGLAARLMDCDGRYDELAARHKQRIAEYITGRYGSFTLIKGPNGLDCYKLESAAGESGALGQGANGELTARGGEKLAMPLGAASYTTRVQTEGDLGMGFLGEEGSPVLAAENGTVVMARYEASYGNLILLDHGGGTRTLYAHNAENLVKNGDEVARGQQIAALGSSGDASAPMLYFAAQSGGEWVNPKTLLEG